MKCVVIALVFLVSLCSCDITDYLILNQADKQAAQAFVHECYESSKVDDAIFFQAVLCQDMSDSRIQEFLYCYFRKYNFITEDNEFNNQIILPIMSTASYNMAVKCTKLAKNKDALQQSTDYMECFVKNYVNDVCKKKSTKFYD